MKTHTTNYQNTFIEVAEDSPASHGEVPPVKNDIRTVASMQYDMICKNPYKYTSDDVLFHVHAERKDLTPDELEAARIEFFSKGQACMRASPLTKRYGWGVHHNENGKIAIYPAESEEYERLVHDKNLKIVKAMKSSR